MSDMSNAQLISSLTSHLLMVISVYSMVCAGFLLAKTGEKWWKILIPFYGGYVYYKKTTDMGVMYWVILAMAALGTVAVKLSIFFGLFFALNIVIFNIAFMINLAVSFDRKPRYALGLVLLYPVFIGMLAFGKAEFVRNV